MNERPAKESSSKRRRVAGAIAAVLLLVIVVLLLRRSRVAEERREEVNRTASGETRAPDTSQKPGAAVPGESAKPAADAPLPDAGLVPKTRGTIKGRITESVTGAPIAGAEVFGAPAGSTEFHAERGGFCAKTDADGRYSVEVDAGSWELNARAGEYASFRIELAIRKARAWQSGESSSAPWEPDAKDAPYKVNVAAGGTSVFDATLASGVEIRGVVTDVGGTPLEGAVVKVGLQIIGHASGTRDPLMKEEPSCITDASGRFRIGRFFPEGQVELLAECRGYSAESVRVDVTAPVPEATLVLKATLGFAGIVTDVNTLPVAGAFVFLDDAGWGKHRFEKTAADGTFRIESPCGNCTWIAAWAPGHGWAGVNVDLKRGEFLRIFLPGASGEIKGVVKNDEGQPVAGARVVVTFLRRRKGPVHGVLSFREESGSFSHRKGIGVWMPADARPGSATTNDQGEFVLKGLAIDDNLTAEIAVVKAGYCRMRQFVLTTELLEVSLTPGEGDDPGGDVDFGDLGGENEGR